MSFQNIELNINNINSGEDIDNNEKYKSGFDSEWFKDNKLNEKAKEFFDFYKEQFSNLNLEVNDTEEILIHFTTDSNLKNIQENKDNKLLNNSNFYDGGREKLSELGFDLEKFDKQFGKKNCVVTIPFKSFQQWAGTLSWLKLTESGALENVVIMKVPRKDIILRDHSSVEKMFKLCADNDIENKKELDSLKLNYFNSTSAYNVDLINDNMLEAWVPHEIPLENSEIINFNKSNK